MRLLVTGGSGYLGRELLRRRPDAVGTVHRADGEVRLDVRDASAVAELVARLRPECVIHTAYTRGGDAAWAPNVDGARNAAAGCASCTAASAAAFARP